MNIGSKIFLPRNGGGKRRTSFRYIAEHLILGLHLPSAALVRNISNEIGGEHGYSSIVKLHVSDQVKRQRHPGRCLPDRDLNSKLVESIARVTTNCPSNKEQSSSARYSIYARQ